MTLIELHVKALKPLQDDKSFRTAKLNQCQSNIGKMQFGRLITFLSLLKVTYPHIEGWGRSEVVKTPDGKTKIIYSSIREYLAMVLFEKTKDSNPPVFTDEQVTHRASTYLFCCFVSFQSYSIVQFCP